MSKKVLLSIVSVFVLILSSNAQTETVKKEWKDGKDLKEQYDMFFDGVSTYKEFYLLSKPRMNQLYASFTDTIKGLKNQITPLKNQITELNGSINKLTGELTTVKTQLVTTETKVDTINVLGSDMNKGAFSTIMWLLVILLSAASAFLFVLFKRSNLLTTSSKKATTKLEEEIESMRKKNLEQVMKLRRELQTAINAYEDLKGKR